MYIRAQGPGQMTFFAEEGDPIVLTDREGSVIAGPHPAPPASSMVIEYNGPSVRDAYWGVLNPDGTLAFQAESFGQLWPRMTVTLEFQPPPDDFLTTDDRKWLKRMTQVVAR